MSDEKHRKLFIGGLDPAVEESELFEYFSHYGPVEDCFVLRDIYSGRHRGFGFVAFQNAEAVDAVQAARPHRFRNREVQLKRAVPKEQFERLDGHLTVNKLFVGAIGDQVQQEQLQSYFGQFGTVNRVDIIVDRRTGLRRGFAFVELDDYDPVDKVILRGPHTINGRTLEVRKAMTRYEMMLLKEKKTRDFRGAPAPFSRSPSWRNSGIPPFYTFPQHYDIYDLAQNLYAPWLRGMNA